MALVRGAKDGGAAKHSLHVEGKGVICDTDARGYDNPRGLSPLELVLDATEGFIPLWAYGTTLRWRFQERSLDVLEDPDDVKRQVEELIGTALLAWGDACPVKFVQRDDAWDFEIAVRDSDRCNINGCVLARAFFPDPGRHDLIIYPKMFEQSPQEQVETMCHEIGHIFGLRHFFAQITETEWRSEIFGGHSPFTIMTYGENSRLTEQDKSDLRKLYQLVWSGELTKINNTPIKMISPYHTIVGGVDGQASLRLDTLAAGPTVGVVRLVDPRELLKQKLE